MEAIQESADREMNTQNVVYMCNGLLLSLKKEEDSDTWYKVHKPCRDYAKWIKPVTR